MEFDNSDVMKSFPGLYVSDSSKKPNNDSDYSDEGDANSVAKKDLLSGKKKKDKKDKDRGYAALEGESSAEETPDVTTAKSKKTKSFKFPSKSKEKREKSREKELGEKKKDKEKKPDKEKSKPDKKDKKAGKSSDECGDIAEGLPIFGVSVETSVERSRCHDGVNIPLPVRLCIDYVQSHGLTVENVYKVSGAKSKVLQLKRMFNQRQDVNLNEFDVASVTSLLKTYLRELPEPLLTGGDLVTRFEEAGAILNVATREKHLRTLVDNLPPANRLLLAWLLAHWDAVLAHERHNRMNAATLAHALHGVLHVSVRLLTTLLYHARSQVFAEVAGQIQVDRPYIAPQPCGVGADAVEDITTELAKQESLLTQLHAEMNAGFICRQREELLWEVQRFITQLKRKKKEKEAPKSLEQQPSVGVNFDISTSELEPPPSSSLEVTKTTDKPSLELEELHETPSSPVNNNNNNPLLEQPAAAAATTTTVATLPDVIIPLATTDNSNTATVATTMESNRRPSGGGGVKMTTLTDSVASSSTGEQLAVLQYKHRGLCVLRDQLMERIGVERAEIAELRRLEQEIETSSSITASVGNPTTTTTTTTTGIEYDENLDHVMELLAKENQILQIKKIELVRHIMEQQELCVNLRAKLLSSSNSGYSQQCVV